MEIDTNLYLNRACGNNKYLILPGMWIETLDHIKFLESGFDIPYKYNYIICIEWIVWSFFIKVRYGKRN